MARGDELINLPVPRKYFTAMVQALARQIDADQPATPGNQPRAETQTVPWPPESRGKEQIYIDWDQDKLSKLRKRLNNSAALTLLEMAADKPGQRISVEDVMSILNCTHGQVGAGLAVLTRSVSKALELKDKRFNWPAAFNWDPEQQKTYYVMDENVAEAWNATVADASTPSQRETMRATVARFGMDESRVIEGYVTAEKRGEVHRKSNDYNTSAEKYARALWKDGVRKGWLTS
jgi:hypothetical protein